MFLKQFTLLSVLFLALLFPGAAQACPLVDGLVDYNCDSVHKILVAGDSIVNGVGDRRFGNQGGYVARLNNRFVGSSVINLGIPGITSSRLLRDFKQNLTKEKEGATKKKSQNIDLLILQVGTNDFWDRNSEALTVRNIRRLVKFLRKELAKQNGVAPLIAVATLPPTKREFQNPFIAEVNRQLLRLSSKNLPVAIRFDTLPERFISFDLLHPSSKGYVRMAKAAGKFVVGAAQSQSAKDRPDRDRDGIYDFFEPAFGTDPSVQDTDMDGLDDGSELFFFRTNPLDPDSDDDTVSDGAEVSVGTDPLSPSSTFE